MTRFSQGGAQRADSPDEQQRLASWYTPGLSDALGDRLLMFDNSTSSSLELLRFKPEFSKAEGFEAALRLRVEELANFTHPSVAKVRAVESLGEEDGLALISNHTVGRRLSEILQDAHGPQFASELVSQLLPVLAALQEQGQGMAHGLLTPERVIVTPEGRLVLSEHVLAAAIDALHLSPEKLRERLGLVMPAGASTLDDPRADIVQLGYLALSLLVGRQVRSLDAAREIVGLLNRPSLGNGRETPRYLHQWLVRALQVDGSSFESANDAERALTDWPERELASEHQLPREVAAPPVVVQPISPKPVVAKVAPPGPPAIARPAPKPEPPPVNGFSTQPVPAPEFLPEPPAPPFPAEEPEPLPGGSLLGLRPSAPPSARASVSESLLQPVPQVARQPEPLPQVLRQPEPVRQAPEPAGEAQVRLKPTERKRSEPVRFLVEPEPARPFEAAEPAPREPAKATPVPRQTPFVNRLVAGLTVVCLVESLIIAGLLASRASVTAAATPTRPEASAATPAAPDPVAARPEPAAPAPAAARPAAPTTVPERVPVAPPITLTRGWLTIEAQFEMQIFENATLIGTTRSERLSLLAGPHELRLVNTSLNFETVINVEIPPGVGITTRVATPNGTLSLNAVPWANVSLDGKSLGTTPVMNLSVPVGSHEVTWRHPQLGERRQTVVVTARGPVTLVTDLLR
jgi:hypothetical protein